MPHLTHHRVMRSAFVFAIVAAWATSSFGAEFGSAWPQGVERIWIGPDYHANRLMDWRLRDGRLECIETFEELPMRTVHLLTATLDESPQPFAMSVELGAIDADGEPNAQAWAGFLIGVGGKDVDYRLSALTHHRPGEDGGILVAVDGAGRLTFRDNTQGAPGVLHGGLAEGDLPEMPAKRELANEDNCRQLTHLTLELVGQPNAGGYDLVASVRDGAVVVCTTRLENVDPARLCGNVALVSHRAPRGDKLGYWFRDWRLSGEKVVAQPKHAYGPVLCALHTLSDGVLKLTAQMGPLGEQDTQTARLETQGADGAWRTVGESKLEPSSCTFPFRVARWDASRATPYRVVYDLKTGPDETRTCYYEGVICKEPKDRGEIVIAAFTCHRAHVGTPIQWNSNAIWFPHNDVVSAVKYHKPDMLLFSGDQVYEGDLTRPMWGPPEKARLDYLEKWFRWCWAFRELARDLPCVCIPDDHDVYHGNLWGDGGHATDNFGKGGYYMSAEFVKMVERTQSSHLPDPYDPTPVDQGIGVYYTSMDYAGVSVAILEDRKWKSPPAILPEEADIVHGWIQNPDFEAAAHAETVGAKLLGQRQLDFLRVWSQDWRDGVWMKMVLSQTLFANLATIPEGDEADGQTSNILKIAPGETAPGQKLARDLDSNGWPPPARDRALREFRRALAFHINGDQHLGSVVHYGADDWEDAGYSFCTPAIGNIWTRCWHPPQPGENHAPDAPNYTGRFRDGYGNRITVQAVANPRVGEHEPHDLHDRVTGYGIIRLNRLTREITFECWPRWSDPSQPNAQQFLGWPVKFQQLDNGLSHPGAYLATIRVTGMNEPVVQVIDESNQEVVYTLRASGSSFRPPVRKAGLYTIKVGELGTPRVRVLEHVRATPDCDEIIDVEF